MIKEEAVVETAALAVRTPTPMQLMEMAIQRGTDAETMGKLLDLQLKYQANEARLAYVAAMHAFKKSVPIVLKTKLVSFKNKDNSLTEYKHAELDKASDIVAEELMKHGVTHAWRTSDVGGRTTVTCVFTHEMGHAEDVSTLSGPADTSGGKNNIQAIGSTTTYLQRYTLLSGAGIVAKNQDDDGRKGEGMDTSAIEDYCIQMQDAMSIEELKPIFKECYEKSKALSDNNTNQTFIKVYEGRKRDFQRTK